VRLATGKLVKPAGRPPRGGMLTSGSFECIASQNQTA
jgi:hypothetical protein